eukprot:CAMPEP_0198322990 /NCGR_PEP_ID=MMETSP1450-20131203/11356_1 /TAXON_ID=753684 ORGANISM="Madagascaria erythrocladiodes, Strain CCMP3234" /NCGR_SAMPLE_ID=MMETSP1450 /ASSEMBLY_ACC=CAM_ASM_001115 /LENGTH=74 /DNA_ID=CAMNT_0044026661 /DNA_START=647 /DNA_END=869 /DNA_ORIENTATION=+
MAALWPGWYTAIHLTSAHGVTPIDVTETEENDTTGTMGNDGAGEESSYEREITAAVEHEESQIGEDIHASLEGA